MVIFYVFKHENKKFKLDYLSDDLKDMYALLQQIIKENKTFLEWH